MLCLLNMVRKAFRRKPDIIIFGHSHAPVNEVKDGILFFNPGSATDSMFPENASFGIIEIEGDDIRAEIIKIEDE